MSWSLEEAIEYYRRMGAPADQNTLIQLLREIQAEMGTGIPEYMLKIVASNYGIKDSLLLALVRRIPSLRLENRHLLELCAGPNCGKHRELAEYAERLKGEGHKFDLKFVPCMRMCGKGPNLRWDGKLYHGANKEMIGQLLGK